MASDYDVAFVYQEQQKYIPFNIDKINAQEKADFGTVDFCGDSLEVFSQ
jgi:hypothetical protein